MSFFTKLYLVNYMFIIIVEIRLFSCTEICLSSCLFTFPTTHNKSCVFVSGKHQRSSDKIKTWPFKADSFGISAAIFKHSAWWPSFHRRNFHHLSTKLGILAVEIMSMPPEKISELKQIIHGQLSQVKMLNLQTNKNFQNMPMHVKITGTRTLIA